MPLGCYNIVYLQLFLVCFYNESSMFSTLDPLPEANMTIFFEDNFVAVFLILSL